MSRSVFITATDTGAGKTWVTAHLFRYLLQQGVDVQALKPLASGVLASGLNEDVKTLLDVQGKTDPLTINFHTYITPVAPALAANLEGNPIRPKALCDWVASKEKNAQITLIEGVGGLMVPLISNQEETWLVGDWLQSMPRIDVMLVVPLRLGCMNDLLLSSKYLLDIGCPPKWIVLNDIDNNQTGKSTIQVIVPVLKRFFNVVPQIICVQKPEDMDIKL